MFSAKLKSKAYEAVHEQGALLVYPLNNKKEPLSLWSELFPRSKMRWEWTETADDRVSDLWILREQMSRSRKVVYAKWYQGRATFFSPEVFVHLVGFLGSQRVREALSPQSQNVLELLESDSPLSTKQLKAAADLEGRMMEPTYNRAMKPLWNMLFVVGFGEFQDSSFPSLGIGASSTLFEDLWRQASVISPDEGEAYLRRRWTESNPFWKFAKRVRSPWNDLVLENPKGRVISDSSEENP